MKKQDTSMAIIEAHTMKLRIHVCPLPMAIEFFQALCITSLENAIGRVQLDFTYSTFINV
jgi:hypothetical protein